jgi:hypothetical protein
MWKQHKHTLSYKISIKPPSKREIIEAIKTMKKGEAAGIDNIPAEILQVDPHLSTEMLYPLFLDIWKEERFPKDWKEGIIVKIPKRGDYRNCNNWRGITRRIRKVSTVRLFKKNDDLFSNNFFIRYVIPYSTFLHSFHHY